MKTGTIDNTNILSILRIQQGLKKMNDSKGDITCGEKNFP